MTYLHGPDLQNRAAAARLSIQEVDSAGVRKMVDDGATLIDVREAEEFEAGHLPGARNVSASILSQQASSILRDPSHPVVLICAGGNRSAIAALELQDLGYNVVVSLKGGLREWPDALVGPVSSGR
jgi:rhodanese-related sulfurtransferase